MFGMARPGTKWAIVICFCWPGFVHQFSEVLCSTEDDAPGDSCKRVNRAVALVFAAQAVCTPASAVALMATGNAGLKSAGALTFGPDGVLFVGDSTGGAIAALDTDDSTPARADESTSRASTRSSPRCLA